ncbi:unnamed protein product [Periconia digitata]|uniref:Uncharacterized protein n=1 Tax=Periconia digitata TaxID=1303443 RepID=A0A9W4XGR9_9PLEO|nr:unnamed protein product [Periconia digitata]
MSLLQGQAGRRVGRGRQRPATHAGGGEMTLDRPRAPESKSNCMRFGQHVHSNWQRACPDQGFASSATCGAPFSTSYLCCFGDRTNVEEYRQGTGRGSMGPSMRLTKQKATPTHRHYTSPPLSCEPNQPKLRPRFVSKASVVRPLACACPPSLLLSLSHLPYPKPFDYFAPSTSSHAMHASSCQNPTGLHTQNRRCKYADPSRHARPWSAHRSFTGKALEGGGRRRRDKSRKCETRLCTTVDSNPPNPDFIIASWQPMAYFIHV